MIEEKFKKHLQHTRSSVEGKKPTAENLLFGEIAVNYNADNEFLAIKNSEGEIVTFPRNIGSAQTRESVDEEAKQGIVALDDFLDSGFTSVNPVTNRVLSKTIMENEEVVAAALNDLNIRIDESYQKPLAGIPKSDLELSIQESLSKADTALQGETDPIFMASAAQGITNEDIENWNGKTEKVIIDVDANGINNSYIDVEDTSLYQSVHSAIQEGKIVFLRLINNDLYPFILRLISCPPQIMTYDFATTFSTGYVAGGRVSSAYASVAPEGYTLHCGVNYFYKKPNNGVPKSDLAQNVQASLDKADSSVQTTGGTVNGTLKATTISAATYQNLPLASSSTTGVMKVGNGLEANNGTVSVKDYDEISFKGYPSKYATAHGKIGLWSKLVRAQGYGTALIFVRVTVLNQASHHVFCLTTSFNNAYIYQLTSGKYSNNANFQIRITQQNTESFPNSTYDVEINEPSWDTHVEGKDKDSYISWTILDSTKDKMYLTPFAEFTEGNGNVMHSAFDVKYNADIVNAVISSPSITATTMSAGTYNNLPSATTSTLGVVKVGNGINVSNGTISLKAGTNISISSDNSINCTADVTPDLTGVVMKTGSTMTGKLSVNNGGLDVTGDTKVNGTLSATSISSPNLSITSVSGTTIKGASISGTSVSGGTVSGTTIKGASISGTSVSGGTVSGTTVKGASISGTSVSGGTVSGTTVKGATVSATTYTNLPTATTTSFGVIRVGNGLSVTNGVVSVTSLDGSYVNTTGDTMSGKLSVTSGGIAVSGASTFSSTLTAATVNATNISGTTVKGATISATTYSNLPTASTSTLGMMKVGNGLSVTNGEVSVNSLDGKYVNVSGDTMTGKLSVTSGGIAVSGSSTFNGTVTAATVNATNISGTTVKGSTISGATASLTGNLTVGGDINATGAMYSSDKRLKENIGNISNEDLEKVSNVDIVKFNFKSDESKRTKYGVIAQDIENIGFSNLVGEKIDGTKNVDYISLLMLEIEYLKKEIKDLKAKLG